VVPIVNDNRLTAEQLAQAVQDEEISFEDALLYHLLNNLGVGIEDPALFLALTLAIGWANMGRMDETVDLPDGPVTVAQIIERFQLQAFLEK
jgi:hypothetical protein